MPIIDLTKPNLLKELGTGLFDVVKDGIVPLIQRSQAIVPH
jgi:hypothetical protein